jgi:putative membrane protein
VSNRIETFFSQADREAITIATTEAERDTAAELVVYVVERCDPHSEIAWKATLVGGAAGAACAALAVQLVGGWGTPDDLWLLLGVQLGLLAGWLLSRCERVARRLIDDEALESRVAGRASEAFLEEQVYATTKRTGVLIFLALFEHRVVVLPDEGIRDRVEPDAWGAIATRLAAGIRAGRPAPALIEAVGRCARLLKEHRTPGEPVDQLSNEPRFRDA